MNNLQKKIKLGTLAASGNYGLTSILLGLLIMYSVFSAAFAIVYISGETANTLYWLMFFVGLGVIFIAYSAAKNYVVKNYGEVNQRKNPWKQFWLPFIIGISGSVIMARIPTLTNNAYLYGWLAVFALGSFGLWLVIYRGVSKSFLYAAGFFGLLMLLPWHSILPNLNEAPVNKNIAAYLTFIMGIGFLLFVEGITNFRLATTLRKKSLKASEVSYESV